MEKIIIRVATLEPTLFLVKKNRGNPIASAAEKQISCLLVRLNTTFVLTVLKSFGTDT